MNIIFTNTSNNKSLEIPKSANNYLPDWYKNTDSYINKEKEPGVSGETSATIKKCIPVFDAITSGYIIVSVVDVYVKNENGKQIFKWPSLNPIGFHPVEQAPIHPARNVHPYPKWINFWSIKTPKGYSTLFVPPMHRESVFVILPGIVDTDKFTMPINFPFTITDPNFEGLIPKGTPIAQVIPFKREKWVIKIGNKKELKKISMISDFLITKFYNQYKNFFWNKKEYN